MGISTVHVAVNIMQNVEETAHRFLYIIITKGFFNIGFYHQDCCMSLSCCNFVAAHCCGAEHVAKAAF